MDKYLGLDIQKLGDGNFALHQPFLIQHILEALGIEPSMTNKLSVPVIGPLLSKDTNGPAGKQSWSYRSVMGMLRYLQGSTRPACLWPCINALASMHTLCCVMRKQLKGLHHTSSV
jgi:hypothetical protein